MSNQTENAKKLYKKWWFWIIIVVFVLVIGSNLMENNTKQVSSNTIVSNKDYEHVSYKLENNSTEKIEKIVTNINTSSEEMKEIYNEKKKIILILKHILYGFFQTKIQL